MTNKEVRFGSITIREYPVILGDNPACNSGPPVRYVALRSIFQCCWDGSGFAETRYSTRPNHDSLDWTHHCSNEFNVDDYESGRPPRKSEEELYLPDATRWIMLLNKHSPVELDAVIQDVASLQRLRELTTSCADEEDEKKADKTVHNRIVIEQKKSSTHQKKAFKSFFGRIAKSKSSLKSRLRRRTTSSVSTEDSTAPMEAGEFDMDDSVMDDGRDDTHTATQEESSARPLEDDTFAAESLEI
jgi:hypothetical protein